MKNKKNNGQRKSKFHLNKKGDVALYLIAVGVLLFAVVFLIYVGKFEGKLDKIGENTVKVINTFEMSERVFSYTDMSMELAAEKAGQETISTSGYLQETFKGKIQNQGCGTLAYPIIDSDKVSESSKGIDECFPDYTSELELLFARNFNSLIINYDPFEISPSSFTAKINQGKKDMEITVSSVSDLNIPVYSYVESYYRSADKTKTSTESTTTLEKNSYGYFTMKEYLILNSFDRNSEVPSRIVIHDTKTSSVQETFNELQTGIKNYNYVIDTSGEIYEFAPEERYVHNADCTKGTTGSSGASNTCVIESVDKESISIALVNKDSKEHTSAQIKSLEQLIADISLRNPTMEITEGTITLNSEIDTSRKNDPYIDIALKKSEIINEAIILRTPEVKTSSESELSPSEEISSEKTKSTSGTAMIFLSSEDKEISDEEAEQRVAEFLDKIMVSEEQDSSGTETTANENKENTLTGYASSDIDESKCFTNIKTTIYYTPSYSDHGNLWSSHAAPCTNSLGYCCIDKENRGFYEEVMCQGSGVAGGKVYHYTTISSAGLSQSTPISGVSNGITSTGTDPTPKRTVAADPDCAGFEYGSKLYIYWGEDNPWNGYYVVEDTGSAFKGNCDKMDIYAGVGEESLEEASKYVGESAKVCVLDSDFEMPDPDFSGSSSFVDPISGEYTVSYAHTTTLSEINKLFLNTKKVIYGIINNCAEKSDDASKETCITTQMKQAESAYDLEVKYCDEAVSTRIWTISDMDADMSLMLTEFKETYKLIVNVEEISADNVNLFTPLSLITTQESTEIKQSPLSELTKTPSKGEVKVSDESGKSITILFTGNATEWIDYYNTTSKFYETDAFLRPGDTVLINVTRILNSTFDGYVINDSARVYDYPKNIMDDELIKFAKTLAECATSNTACTCTTEPTRMLGDIKIDGDEITATGNSEVYLTAPFSVNSDTEVSVSTSKKNTFIIQDNKITLIEEGTKSALAECVPRMEYRYICASLKDNEALGTLKYTVKI